jgi:hypothetical protein
MVALSSPSAQAQSADLTTWPSQYKIAPWEASRLTAADVVGPDGIVYPDFTGVGVTGGIPDVNNSTVRATYTVFNVVTYGAEGDGVTNDDAAVAAAATAARNHLNASSSNKAILYFPAGTYVLDTPVSFTQSNIVVDGDGPTATIIKLATDTAHSGNLFTFSRPTNFTGYLTVTAFAPRGSNTLTLSANPATSTFTVGCWVRLHPTVSGAGKTMSDRFSNPANGVTYTDAFYHTGRVTWAKVTAMDAVARTVTLDRTLAHDYFVDESPSLRRLDIIESSGIQDLTIETVAATATLHPIRFQNAANSWIKNIKTLKARDWPIYTSEVTRFEVRDCQFLGTWININQSGGVAYLGWCDPASDSLMDNVHASDLRHMGIFQLANRCVIRNSTFTGQTIQSPQLHGRFPHENLIEGCTFNNTYFGGANSRSITSFGSDGAYSTIHGVNGPRNVYYNNQVLAGMATAAFNGVSEGFIFAYNRILKNDDNEAKPAVLAMDRTFDFTLRGNVFQAINALPALTLTESTCTGWDVTDNKFYGSNGHLFEGDSEPALAHNNRFFSSATTPDAATAPEVASIYAWQKANANTARLVLVIPRRTVTDTGGTTQATVVRVKAATTSDLTVTLSADIAGLSFPATVTIPAGAAHADFTLTGVNVSGGEKLVTLTATAPGLLADPERVAVLDQDVAQPNFGVLEWPVPATGLPANWKAANHGIVTSVGSQSFDSGTGTWSISGAGIAAETFQASLVRAGRKFVYQTIDGDGEIRARITSATGDNQVGLMIADDESAHTDFIWVQPNGRVLQAAAAGTKVVPSWLRLKRTGSVFTAYRSTVTTPTTEADWTVLATVNLYTPTETAYKSPAIIDRHMHYGMFINSGSATNLANATFTNVQLTGTIVSTVTGPNAPGGLSAALVGNTQANLSWTDNSTDETGFEIEVRIGSSPNWNLLATVGANVTSSSQTGLLDGTTYHYRVRAVRSTDSTASAYSGSASATTTLTTLPIAPAGGSASGISESEIQLSWIDNAHNESGYEIQRSTEPDSGFALLTTLGANASGYVDSNLPDGARYYYRVRAVNALGHSTYTAAFAGITRLIAPGSLVITTATDTDITLSWSDNSANETGTVIERSATSGSGFVEIGTAGANVTTFTDTTVVPGATYFYRVRATNAVAQSDDSSEVSATATAYVAAEFYEPFNYSLSPTSVVGRAGSGTGSTSTWTVVSGSNATDTLLSGNLSAGRIMGQGNHLRVGEVSNNTRLALGLAASVRSNVVNPPANGSRTFWISYLVRTPGTFANFNPNLNLSTSANTQVLNLWAHTGNNNRRYSLGGANLTTVNSANQAIVASTTYCYIAKVTVTDTDGNAANGLERIEARLWQYPSGNLPPLSEPTSGGLYRSATTVSSRLIDRVSLTGGSASAASRFVFDEIRIGSSYAQVALPPPPAAPTGLTFTSITNTDGVLSWTDHAVNETSYRIQRATSAGGPYTTITTLGANATTYTDTGLTAGTTYHYRVKAVGEVYESVPAIGSFTTLAPPVSISGTITLSGSGSGVGGVTVSDGTRSATTAANGTYTITNVPSGNYTLTPTLSGHTFTPATRSVTVAGSNLSGEDFSAIPPAPVVGGNQTANGTVGTAFSYTLQASNSPTGYAHAGGSMPPGLSLNTSSGAITGTPTTAGTYNPTFTATNAGGTSTAVAVNIIIASADGGLLICSEPFNYTLGATNPDPDGGLNANNGLPATNAGGIPAGTSVGLYGVHGTDQTVVEGLSYSDAWGTLHTSANALRRHTGTGFSASLARVYRQMTSDPFATYRSTADANLFGWNGSTARQLFFSVLLHVNAVNTGVSNRFVLNMGTDNASWNVYISQENGTTKWRYGDQSGSGSADLGNAAANQTVLLVGRLSFNSATQFVTEFWFNPPLGQPLGTPTHTRTYTTTTSGGQFRGIQTRDGANILTYDEFRLGTTQSAVMPYTPVPIPNAPSGLAASGGSHITLSWTDNAANETGFKLERSPNGSTGWTQIATPAADATNFADSGLNPGTTYFYRICATNGSGDSAYSNIASATTWTGLESFRSANGLALDGSEDSLMPAGDGISNLLKYAFNMLGGGAGQVANLTLPNAAVLAPGGSAGLPLVGVDGTGQLQITYIRRKAATNPGITYSAEWSDTLAVGSWATNPSASESVTSIDATFERVTLTDPTVSPGRRFARIRISQ